MSGRGHPRSVWFAGILLLVSLSAAAEVRLTLEGVEGELAERIRAVVDPAVQLDSDLAARFYRERVSEQMSEALQAYGYYEPTLSVDLKPVHGHWALEVEITPGPQVLWRSVDIAVVGEGEDDPAFSALLARLPISPETPLNHADYARSKRALRNLALERGYFDYQFKTARLAVHVPGLWADAELTLDTGARYTLGAVSFSPSPFRQRFLERLVPFAPGAPYSAETLAQLNERLLESGYFDDALVETQRDLALDGQIPVTARLFTRARNTVTTGVGFSTDEGPRAQLGFTRHYINNRGHRLESRLRVSPLRQVLNARYEIPLADPLNDSLSLVTGWENEDVEDARSERYSVALARRQQFTSGWVRTQSIRWLDERFTAGVDRGKAQLLLPGIAFSRTRSRGGIDPYRGDHQSYSVEGSARDVFSDVDIARLRLSNTWLRSLGQAHRFQLRADLGAIATNDFGRTPTSLRFFAGGDQSVRGFAYRSLGPQDANGEVTGGRYLATGSAEYSYAVHGNWRLASFIDGGNAFDQVDEVDAEVGAGLGLRWSSPVGPLRLDFAWGVSRDDPPFRVHLSVGPPF